MSTISRRHFIGSAIGLALVGTSAAESLALAKKRKPLLAYSTLGSPKWSYDTILEYASKNGYKGIEIRGILDEMDLPKCPEFNSPERVKSAVKKAKKHGVQIVGLGASARLHLADPKLRQENLDEAKRFIDLAHQLNCPYVRVFPNNLPKDQDREHTIQLIIDGLKELGDYAKKTKVKVLLESHGEVVGKDLLLRIMQASEHPNVGLIWDIFNMWSVTKEPPAEVYATLKKYILHVHVKDAVRKDDKWHYVQVGKGETPIPEGLSALVRGGYKGFYAFEWEKKWHPTIAEPEVVIPEFPKAIAPLLSV
jgi:sugar phosphate isomerase/epimerase